MMHGFRIGRTFGIDIRIDWSWLFIVVLLTWSLSAVFSAWQPGRRFARVDQDPLVSARRPVVSAA